MNNQLPVLIYKRTHTGDPDEQGIFGIHDCMGKVRDWEYRAVIGIGGKRPWAGSQNIAEKITWIGISPNSKKKPDSDNSKRGSLVTFEKFCLYDANGPLVVDIAPNLHNHMLGTTHRRVVMGSLPANCQKEVDAILKLVEGCCRNSQVDSDGVKKIIEDFNETLGGLDSCKSSGCNSPKNDGDELEKQHPKCSKNSC